jgi:hypothetical protein
MSSPDRADTAAVVTEAVDRAAEYWNTEFDEEAMILARLHLADVVITRQQFAEMVEAKIAISWADQHADLSRFGLPDDCNWITRAEFIREQREGWFDAILAVVVSRTRAPRELDLLASVAA